MEYKKIDGKTAEIRLYGNIGNWFTSGDVFSEVIDHLSNIGVTSVVIRMHCYGGSVFEGNVIGNVLKRSKLDISIAIDGIAASMGCFLLPYLPAEKVTIASNGFGMLHRPSSYVSGDADDLKNEAKLLEDIEIYFISVLSQRTGKTKEEIRKTYFDGKDHWLNAEEMLSLKLVGKISDKLSEIESLDKDVLLELGMETVYGKYAAKLTNNNNKNEKSMDKNLIITTFGLSEVTADSNDVVILSKLQEKFSQLTNEIKELKTAAKAAVTKEIDEIIETAIQEKRIVASGEKNIETVKSSFRKVGEDSGVEALKNVIGHLPSQESKTRQETISSQIKDETGKTEKKDFEWYRKNDVTALLELEKNDPERFRQLYKETFGSYPEGK
jgi:ATP-dependent protease ClpP protease subunit